MELERIHHVGIVTNNIDETIDFYKSLLGLQLPESDSYGSIQYLDKENVELKYAMLEMGQKSFFVEIFEPIRGPHLKMLQEHGEQSIAEVCFEVDDIVETYDAFEANGIVPVDDGNEPLNERKYVEFPTGSRGFYLSKEVTGNLLVELLQPYYNVEE